MDTVTYALINGKLAEKANQADLIALGTRVDTIITTPVDGVSAQEIIDARQGAATLGANIEAFKNDTKEAIEKTVVNFENDLIGLGDGTFLKQVEVTGDFITVNDAVYLRANVSSESDSLTIHHLGKNILETPYFYSGSRTNNGITYTYNEDGSITVSGTATDVSTCVIYDESPVYRKAIKPGEYVLSGCPEGGSNTTYRLVIGITGVGEKYDYGDGVNFTISSATTYYLKFIVYPGMTVNFTIKPQIEVGTNKTDWEKYHAEILELTNGNCYFKMFDGINNLYADTEFTLKYVSKIYNRQNEINLKDCGAVGDGVTDDTNAINEALAMAAGKTLFVPPGTYLFSGTLRIKSNTRVVGSGDTSVFQLANVHSLDRYVWRTNLSSKYYYRYPMMIIEENAEGCVLENFALRGQTSNFVDNNQDGLCIKGRNHIIRNLIVSDINYFPSLFTSRSCVTPGCGVWIFNADTITVDNVHAYNCGYEGFGVEASENIVISGCKCGDANQTGMQVHLGSKHIRIVNNTIQYSEGITRPALTFDADPDQPMSDIHIDNNYICRSVVFVAGGENMIFLTNNYINGGISCNNYVYRNGLFIRGNYISGRVVPYADNAIITDNNIYVNDGYYMIILRGNNSCVTNNIGTGAITDTIIYTHE